MSILKVQVIMGSTREGRYGDKPAHWIFDKLKEKEEIEAELIDLRDWPLPFFNEPVSPSMAKEGYENDLAKKWAAKVAEADAYIIVTPEYNHGYPAVLKNALDWVYYQWNKKPVSFVSYGSVGGARSIEQLRGVVAELQMASMREAVHISGDVYMATMKESVPVNPELFKPVEQKANNMIDQLMWWGNALKAARTAQ